MDSYWNLLSSKIKSNTVRNIMDMKAHMGSFAAALKDKDVWVMNVVSPDGPNTLKLIYDRGLIGTNHNWYIPKNLKPKIAMNDKVTFSPFLFFPNQFRCEAFSTYPRTYDLLHAWTVFSDIRSKGCSAEDLLIEMDRILRPTGFIIIRDKQSVVESIKKYMQALHWEIVASEKVTTGSDLDQDNEDGENNVVFIVQKKLWLTSESLKDTE